MVLRIFAIKNTTDGYLEIFLKIQLKLVDVTMLSKIDSFYIAKENFGVPFFMKNTLVQLKTVFFAY